MEKIELKAHKPVKPPRMTSIEETVQLARIQQQSTSSSAAMYERKPNQKALKVLTVAAYILFVSMAAITLSFYYVFIWDPSSKPLPTKTPSGCDNKMVIPESLAIQLANSSEVSAENYLRNLLNSYQSKHKLSEKMVVVKELKVPPVAVAFPPIPTATVTEPISVSTKSTASSSDISFAYSSSAMPIDPTPSTEIGGPIAARMRSREKDLTGLDVLSQNHGDTITYGDDEEGDDDDAADISDEGEYEASGSQADSEPVMPLTWNGTRFNPGDDQNNNL